MKLNATFSLPNPYTSQTPAARRRTANSKARTAAVSPSAQHLQVDSQGLIFGPENNLLRLFMDQTGIGEHPESDADDESSTAASAAGESRFPLVLHGPSGVGKSTVAHWVALQATQDSAVRKNQPDENRLIQIHAMDLYREFVDAVDMDELLSFRKKYLSASVLLIDNLDELANRKPVFEELIYLLDHCPRLILTSVSHPGDLIWLPPQLTSRILSGLCIAVQNPSVPAKAEIIANEIDSIGGRIERDAARWLAEHECPSLPVLKQKISNLRIHLNLQKTITVAAVKRVFKPDAPHKAPLSLVTRCTAKHQLLKVSDLKSQSRKRSVVQARGMAVYLAREFFEYKYEEIGRFFDRDHSTVMHAHRKLLVELDSDHELKKSIDEILVEINKQPGK